MQLSLAMVGRVALITYSLYGHIDKRAYAYLRIYITSKLIDMHSSRFGSRSWFKGSRRRS